VVEEARRNIAAKTPAGAAALESLLLQLRLAGAQVPQETEQATLKLPEKDRPVLAAAIRLRCDALVTGDRTHFGAVYGKTLAGVTIHSPRSLAEALLL
jgi:uncharacterized protein